MADSEQIMLESSNLENVEQSNIDSINGMGVTEGTDFTEQILQQALQGVSEPVQQNVVQYTTESGENLTLIANGSVLTDVSGNVVGTLNEDGSTYTLFGNVASQDNLNNPVTSVTPIVQQSSATELNFNSQSHSPVPVAITKVSTSENQIENPPISTASLATISNISGTLKSESLPVNTNEQVPHPLYVIRSSAAQEAKPNVSSSSMGTAKPISSLVTSFPTTTSAPLGSSQNPIRIIQQGNHYTSTQQLNPDQLTQIMQVIQEQQAVRQAKQMGGPSVVYNPHTQTKIVYRVINPSDLHSKTQINTTPQNVIQSERPYPGKKRGRKRKSEIKNDDEEDSLLGPELSRKEKEEKKKMRPKTRSGRVSKPPKHMMKDYKQIHLVDWHEDYDDSDGGYSDYRGSDAEDGDGETSQKRGKFETNEDAYENLRPKKFKCNECGKGYIGRTGLDRHWSKFPSHKGEDGTENFTMMDTEASNDSFVNSFISSDSTPAKPLTQVTPSTDQAPVKSTRHAWRKNSKRYKLSELLERCDEELIAEVCLPKLANIVSLWEFLLMKVEISQEEGSKINFLDIHKLFEELRLKIKLAFKDCLDTRTSEQENTDVSRTQFEVTDEEVAKALGIETDTYTMKALPVEKIENDNQYAFLSANPTCRTQNQNHKRPTVVVSQASLISTPLHKTKHELQTDHIKIVSQSKTDNQQENVHAQNSIMDKNNQLNFDLNMQCESQVQEAGAGCLSDKTESKQTADNFASVSDHVSTSEDASFSGIISDNQIKEIDKVQSETVEKSLSLSDENKISQENNHDLEDTEFENSNSDTKSAAQQEVDEIVDELVKQSADVAATDQEDISENLNLQDDNTNNTNSVEKNDTLVNSDEQKELDNLKDSIDSGVIEKKIESSASAKIVKDTDNSIQSDSSNSVESNTVNSSNKCTVNDNQIISTEIVSKETETIESSSENLIKQSKLQSNQKNELSVSPSTSSTSKTLPIVKLELPSDIQPSNNAVNGQVKVICNTEDLEENFGSKQSPSMVESATKTNDPKVLKPNITVTLPSINSVKPAFTSTTSVTKSPGILNRLIKGSLNNTGQTNVVTVPSSKTSKPELSPGLIKQPASSNIRVIRLKSGSSPISPVLSKSITNTNASKLLKSIVLKSPTNSETSGNVSQSRSLIRPKTSSLIKQQKSWMKNITSGSSVMILPSKSRSSIVQTSEHIVSSGTSLLNTDNVTIVHSPQQEVVTTDTSFNTVSVSEPVKTKNEVEMTTVSSDSGIGQLNILSTSENEIVDNSQGQTYSVNPDGTLTLHTTYISGTDDTSTIGQNQILMNENQQQYITSVDESQHVTGTSENETLISHGQIIMGSDGNQHIVTSIEGNQPSVANENQQIVMGADGNQHIFIGADGNQQIVLGSDENQQVVMSSDGNQQIVMGGDGNQQIVMAADGNQELMVDSGDSQQIIMNMDGTQQVVMKIDDNQTGVIIESGNQEEITRGNQQVLMETDAPIITKTEENYSVTTEVLDNQQVSNGAEQSQQIYVDSEGNQVILNPNDSSQVVLTEDGKSQVLTSNVDQNSQVVFSSELNPQVVMSSVVESDSQPLNVSTQDATSSMQELDPSQTVQTEDGIYLVRNPDGTCQIHSNSDQPIPLETIQALMSMAPDQFQLSTT